MQRLDSFKASKYAGILGIYVDYYDQQTEVRDNFDLKDLTQDNVYINLCEYLIGTLTKEDQRKVLTCKNTLDYIDKMFHLF